MALAAVVTQTLLPKIGGGLVPAAELLMVGYGARQHIRKNALQHLHQEITITRKPGSFTLEESLAGLVRDGLVEWRDAHGARRRTSRNSSSSARGRRRERQSGRPNPLLQFLAVAAAQREPGAGAQEHHVLAVEPGLQLLHPLDVHDVRAVNPVEGLRRSCDSSAFIVSRNRCASVPTCSFT